MNEEEKIQNIFDEARNIKLKVEEKSAIRMQLRAFIDQSIKQKENSSVFVLSRFNFMFRPVPMTIILLALITGGLTAAADSSLPNEKLYSLKTGVNEKVLGWFAVSHESKAEYETGLVRKRLQEAEIMAIRNDLDEKTITKIEDDIEKHTQNADMNIKELKTQDKLKAIEKSSELESSLSAHGKILKNMAKSNNSAVRISDSVETKTENTNRNRAKNEKEVTQQNSSEIEFAAQGKLTAAENKISEINSYIKKMESRYGSEAVSEAKTQLEDANNILALGKAKLIAKSYGEAFILFQQAQSRAQEVKIILKTNRELNLEVEKNKRSSREEKENERED
jgi:hypothetical protein